jgi:ribonucleotide reductase alpha subunit
MVTIDYTRDNLITDYAKAILKERYLVAGEDSPQDAFARVAKAFADDDAHAQRLYDYASKLWFGFATPVLSNGGTKRGLPISCFLNYIDDSRQSINEHISENTWLASMGGGIGATYSALRSDGIATSQGSRSTGMIPFMHIVDSQMLAVSQGSNRRGGYASYLDISHPEIIEFINMRKTTGGDPNRKNLNLHHGINIPDSFMEIIERCIKDPSLDDSWDLIDPHTKEVVETVSALYLWGLILETRIETGEPYLHFIDTSNRLRPQAYKDADLEITQSNLCCVTGDTLVTTSKGETPIQKLVEEGKEVDVWNGKEWSAVLPQKTKENEPIYEINILVFNSGDLNPTLHEQIKCSWNHKYYVGGEIVYADELQRGDSLDSWITPTGIKQYGVIDRVVRTKATGDMYCFKEHKRSRGMFNGIVTGNSEILIPTDPETTAVCCLSSVNLEKYDEWKDTDMVRDLIRMLDNVLDYFIENAPKEMHKAIKGATRGRDIGLGAMGFHAYLQSKNIPFESAMASSRNRVMFEDIYSKAKDASIELAHEKEPSPINRALCDKVLTNEGGLKYLDYYQRNVQLMAIAPNASSSIICGGTSPSVEPFSANMYTEKTQNGSNVKRNKFLDLTEEQWKEVSAAKGSVQGLDLDEDTKDTFKTAFEIDQHWIIDHAASRQPYICQSQSINLFFAADCSREYLHSVHFSAWQKGLKTLYYCRSQVVDRAEDINKRFDRFDYKVPENNECLSCEG